MSENNRNAQDLDEILEKIENIDEVKEVEVPLFENIKFESPFKNDDKSVSYFATPTTIEESDGEYTVIGSSTVIDSNIKCGGNIKVKGQVKGSVSVNGSADIFGTIEGDIQANEVTLEHGAKVLGNIICKADVNALDDSKIVGNIVAKNAYINSHVEGDLEILNEVKITSTGSITGKIVTGSISVASGAVLNAIISIRR
ncbi:MAG TPA: polymer-forming cytoskeletal protein [Erysipelotrichaceae bacterium]|jgi:cytoskeletal protein CcmA (bactofilin family)|nr:polymer-forming cytoskeletal protein [Erysipelotrichia bacterium]HPX32599.1 polymer-forming cytoskeletal protein [Erysipelotrichaceae bacterium]HQA85222.1 polymer-forming cytoskeletal protein [Erysipelotrichaceae bacterium]